MAPTSQAAVAAPFGPADFDVPGIYLDSAARHPLPVSGAARLAEYATFLTAHRTVQGLSGKQTAVRAAFARLINADVDEIALVPSTVFGENMILGALGLPSADRQIVTDALHYSGSLDLYRAVADDGASVSIVPKREGGIDLDEMADAIGGRTALIAISSVSHHNGFQHDLKAVCDLAHARGALVYADVIQHAGVLPLDVRATGVDFCACSTYKWLLGEMGLAFLYVRRDRWPLLRRRFWGPRQQVARHPSPDALDPSGLFHFGTLPAGAVEVLRETLPRNPASADAERPPAWRSLAQRIERAAASLDLKPLTPPGSASPIRAFESEAITARTFETLRSRGIRVTGRDGFIRFSPSIFNTADQIDIAMDAFASALKSAGRAPLRAFSTAPV